MKIMYIIILVVWLFACDSRVQSEFQTSLPCQPRDAYGYDNIDNAYDYHDWVLANRSSPHDTPTGSSSNRANDGGCYLLHNTTGVNQEGFSLLVSSCYTAMKQPSSQPMLQFYHYTYGRDVGSLEVYLRQGCLQPDSWNKNTVTDLSNDENKIWEVNGSHNDSWTRVELNLRISTPSPFQIAYKAIVGNSTLSNIALDEISIYGIKCYSNSSFLCDHSNCIPQDWVCDYEGTRDCIDGIDEPEPGCCNPFTKFKCNSGRCIHKEKQCDGNTGDCDRADDNSDETNCIGIPNGQINTSTTKETDISIFSTSYRGDGLTLIPDSTLATEILTRTTHLTLEANTGYTWKIIWVNETETFCQSDSIVSGFDNCSFIGLMIAFGILFIVFLAFITAQISNRCSRDDIQRRKSTAPSETKLSLVPDYSLSLDNLETGHANKTDNCDTMDEKCKSSKYDVVDDDMALSTITKRDGNGEPDHSNGVGIAATSPLEDKEDAEGIEMGIMVDDRHNTEPDEESPSSEQNEGEQVKANNDENHNTDEQSIPVYALPDKTRNANQLQDPSARKSISDNKNDTEQTNQTDKMPVYAKPHQNRDSEVINNNNRNADEGSDVNLDEKASVPLYAEPDTPKRGTRDVDSNDIDAKSDHTPESLQIAPYAETVIAGGNKETTSPEFNDNIPPYSMPDKRKESQVSTASTDLEGYSKIPPTGLSEREEDTDMYEEVKIGGNDSVLETRRPTLPEGHPSLSKLPNGDSAPSLKSNDNRLDAIDEKENPDPLEFYAESNFVSSKPVVKQTNEDGALPSHNAGDGDQTEWADNIVYVSADT